MRLDVRLDGLQLQAERARAARCVASERVVAALDGSGTRADAELNRWARCGDAQVSSLEPLVSLQLARFLYHGCGIRTLASSLFKFFTSIQSSVIRRSKK